MVISISNHKSNNNIILIYYSDLENNYIMDES